MAVERKVQMGSRLRGNDEGARSMESGTCVALARYLVILAKAGIHCLVTGTAASNLYQHCPQLLNLIAHTGGGFELQIPGVVVHLVFQLLDPLGDLRG